VASEPTDSGEAAIARIIERGRRAHPDVEAPDGLAALVAARADAIAASDDPDARAADVYLAAACALGEPAAIARLEIGLPALIRTALARLGVPAADDDEIIQRLRIALFAPTGGGAPAIVGYSGRGALRAYLRAIAVKLALKRLERERSPGDDGDEALALIPAADDSPEMRLLKERCRGEVRRALEQALAALTPRERNLLRQHYLDGLTVDALAPLYAVHRATAARWIDAAREQLAQGVRRHFRTALGLGAAELDNMVGLVQSRLEISLARLLAAEPEAERGA
jgi:RNA polymerase sigma-70 factor, ECF subfamily